PLARVRRLLHVVPFDLEGGHEQTTHVILILDDEDARAAELVYDRSVNGSTLFRTGHGQTSPSSKFIALSFEVPAAVHAHGLAGDEVGLYEEHHRADDGVGTAPAAERRRGFD